MNAKHWSVTVASSCEEIVCIESNCLSGRNIGAEEEAVIRNAAYQLLAFIGDPVPQAGGE